VYVELFIDFLFSEFQQHSAWQPSQLHRVTALIMFSVTRRSAFRAASCAPKANSVFASPYHPSALQRLLSTLAVFEQREGKLNHGSLSAVTAAKKIGGSIHGFVAGSNIKGVADEAAKVDGVEKIIAVDNAAYDKVCCWPCLVMSWNLVHWTEELF
jgi:hypothetical protein